MPITRGSILGFFLGMLPGGGAVMASFGSYAMEKRISRNPGKFGTGAIEGVAGPESANNGAAAGAFIPLLTLGIPANVVMALMIGAFMVHGVTPGPLIMRNTPQMFWAIVTSMYIGNIILLILNVPLIRLFVKIVEIPYAILSPLIIVICVIGAFSINNNPLDVVAMMVFGVVGFLLKKLDYDPSPLLLAYILGSILEKSIHQSLIMSQGSPSIFFTRGISLLLVVVSFLMIVSPFFVTLWRRYRKTA